METRTGSHEGGAVVCCSIFDPLLGLRQGQNPAFSLVGVSSLQVVSNGSLADDVKSLFVRRIDPNLGDAEVDAAAASIACILLIMEIGQNAIFQNKPPSLVTCCIVGPLEQCSFQSRWLSRGCGD